MAIRSVRLPPTLCLCLATSASRTDDTAQPHCGLKYRPNLARYNEFKYMTTNSGNFLQTLVIKAASLLVFAIQLSKFEEVYPWHHATAGRSQWDRTEIIMASRSIHIYSTPLRTCDREDVVGESHNSLDTRLWEYVYMTWWLYELTKEFDGRDDGCVVGMPPSFLGQMEFSESVAMECDGS